MPKVRLVSAVNAVPSDQRDRTDLPLLRLVQRGLDPGQKVVAFGHGLSIPSTHHGNLRISESGRPN